MLVLAIDTATSAVIAGVVELGDPPAAPVELAARVAAGTRKHGELLVPGVLAACAEAGIVLGDLDAVVVGVGPAPFTGLRVGMVTAAALGDALDVPVHGGCSLDAIAVEATCGEPFVEAACGEPFVEAACGEPFVEAACGEPFVVVTDARRREVYWAAYDVRGGRTAGPFVDAPAVAAQRARALGAVAAAGPPEPAAALGLPVHGPAVPSPVGLVTAAAPALRSGHPPGPLVPLYLRRPDATVPGPRKKVTA